MLDLEKNAEELLERASRALRFDPQIGPALSDEERQDLASDTYERLLRRHREGRIYNDSLISLTQKTALNLARNYLAHRNFQGPGDPTDEAFGGSSEELAPDQTLFRKVDLAAGIEAAEQLPEQQLRVYRALVVEELTPGEAIKRLRMRRSTFFKYRKLAFDHVTSALLDGEDSPAARERLKLLAAYDAGIASARQRARARRLLKNDPAARAELLALRRSHRVAAIGLPALVATNGGEAELLRGVFERGSGLLGRARDALTSLLNRGAADTAEGVTNLAGSGAGRAGGVAGAGILAKLTAFGSGSSVVAACVAGGGATVAVCVATGVIALPGPDSSEAEAPREERVRTERVKPPEFGRVETLPSQIGHEETATAPGPGRKAKDDGGGEVDGSQPAPEPVVEETAPVSTQQFGVEAAAIPATGPAPADTNDSDGASAGTVRQEFGP